MKSVGREKRGKYLGPGLIASVLLHLFFILAVQRWAAEPVEHFLHPMRFEVPVPEPSRFASQRPEAVPQVRMERLESDSEAVVDQVDAAEVLQPFEALELAVLAHALEGMPLPGQKSDKFEGAAEDLPSIEQIQMEMAQRRIEALAAYADRWMADADTSDAESQDRRRAEAVVDRAIAAMGGLEAMLKIKDKKVERFVWQWEPRPQWVKVGDQYYAEGRKYREEMGGGIVQAFDGYRSWSYRYGMPRPAPDNQLRQEAEGWDFLSQVKGEGVRLDYGGMRDLVGARRGEGIIVEDRKHGDSHVIYFDPITHLPLVEDGGVRREIVEWQEDKGVKIPREVWTAMANRMWRERFEVDLNVGLDPTFFLDPGPRRWEKQAMRILTQRPVQEPEPPRLVVSPVYQESGQAVMDQESLQLLDFYLEQKLGAVGLLADDTAEYHLQPVIRDFKAVRAGEGMTRYEIVFRLQMAAAADGRELWGREIEYEWKSVHSINDKTVDDLSSLLAEQVGWALLGPGIEIAPLEQEILVWDGPNKDLLLDEGTRQLLRFYLEQKLDAAGLSGGDSRPVVYRAKVVARGFYRAQVGLQLPVYTLTLRLRLYDKRAGERVAEHQLTHRWEGIFPLDSGTGDALTAQLIEKIGAAVQEHEGAPVQSRR